MSQRSFFFQAGALRLLGVLFPAEPSRPPPARVAVILSAFAGEHVVCRPHLADIARQLAAEGTPGFRFDYGGYGDSEGVFEQASPSTMRAEAEVAIERAKAETGAEKVLLLGVRMGATLAAQLAAGREDVDRLALIEPLPDLGKYLYAELRATVAMQTMLFREMRVNRDTIIANIRAERPSEVDGYDMNLIHDGFPLGRAMLEEAEAVNISAAPPALPCPTLLLHHRERPGKPPKPLLQLHEALQGAAKPGVEVALETAVEPSVMWKHGRYYTSFSPETLDVLKRWLAAQGED